MNFFWGEMGGVLVQTQTQVHSSLRASNTRIVLRRIIQ